MDRLRVSARSAYYEDIIWEEIVFQKAKVKYVIIYFFDTDFESHVFVVNEFSCPHKETLNWWKCAGVMELGNYQIEEMFKKWENMTPTITAPWE